MPHESGASQSIEELQTRYQGLAEQKIKVETQRDSALKQLDELKTQARELFGSDDVGQLREKLKEMKDSNELKRQEYQQSLDKIDQDLAAVNEKFSDRESE